MPRLFNDTSTATSAAGRKGRPSTGKATMDSMDMDFDSDALLSGDDEPTTPQRDNDKVLDDAPNSATIVKGVMETSILEKLCQSDQPSDRPTDSTASTASSSPPPPSTTYSSPPPPQASSSSAVRTPPPAPGSSKIVTKSPTTGPFDKAMKANQAAVSPVKKNDPWQEAMKKLKKAGWTYKNHGGGRLDVDYDYYLPGGVALTKGGKPKRDFLEGLDQVKLFAKKYFGWIDGLAEEEMEEDRLAYEERMREERMKKEKQHTPAAAAAADSDSDSDDDLPLHAIKANWDAEKAAATAAAAPAPKAKKASKADAIKASLDLDSSDSDSSAPASSSPLPLYSTTVFHPTSNLPSILVSCHKSSATILTPSIYPAYSFAASTHPVSSLSQSPADTHPAVGKSLTAYDKKKPRTGLVVYSPTIAAATNPGAAAGIVVHDTNTGWFQVYFPHHPSSSVHKCRPSSLFIISADQKRTSPLVKIKMAEDRVGRIVYSEEKNDIGTVITQDTGNVHVVYGDNSVHKERPGNLVTFDKSAPDSIVGKPLSCVPAKIRVSLVVFDGEALGTVVEDDSTCTILINGEKKKCKRKTLTVAAVSGDVPEQSVPVAKESKSPAKKQKSSSASSSSASSSASSAPAVPPSPLPPPSFSRTMQMRAATLLPFPTPLRAPSSLPPPPALASLAPHPTRLTRDLNYHPPVHLSGPGASKHTEWLQLLHARGVPASIAPSPSPTDHSMTFEVAGFSCAPSGTVTDIIACQLASATTALPSALVASIALNMLNALTAVHSAGVLHNDISASSFLVMDDATVRIVGFGNHTLDVKYALDAKRNSAHCYESFRGTNVGLLTDAMYACPHVYPPVPTWLANSKIPVHGEPSCWKYEPDFHGVADCIHMMLFGGIKLRTVLDASSGRVQVVSEISNYNTGKVTWDRLLTELVNLDVGQAPDLKDSVKLLEGLAASGDGAGVLSGMREYRNTPLGLLAVQSWGRVLERDSFNAVKTVERDEIWKGRSEKVSVDTFDEERSERRRREAEDKNAAADKRMQQADEAIKEAREQAAKIVEEAQEVARAVEEKQRKFEAQCFSFVSPEFVRHASLQSVAVSSEGTSSKRERESDEENDIKQRKKQGVADTLRTPGGLRGGGKAITPATGLK